MLEALVNHPFLPLALLAGFASALASGIIGSYVVVKRIVFISGSIAHSVLGGMGFCLWLERSFGLSYVTPFQGALLSALLSAWIIGWIHLKYRQREDTVIAAIWSTGMAAGVIFISLTPGYNVEIMNFLFGNILWITRSDLFLLLVLDALVLATTLFFHKKFLAVCFDEDETTLQGVSVVKYYLLLLSLVALSVVILIQVVGSILVIAMLAIPAASAGRFTFRLSRIMMLATLLGCLFVLLGVGLSYELNWPPGATIALVAALCYMGSLCRRLRKRSSGR